MSKKVNAYKNKSNITTSWHQRSKNELAHERIDAWINVAEPRGDVEAHVQGRRPTAVAVDAVDSIDVQQEEREPEDEEEDCSFCI